MCTIKVSELRGDVLSFFIKVAISRTSHYAGVFCGTDACWSYTEKMIRIQLLASISLTLPRMWLWLLEVYICVCLYVCAQHFIPAWWCATFGSFACCLHLNPQEMENGLQFLKLMLRSDSFLRCSLSVAKGLTLSATVAFKGKQCTVQ